MTNTTSRPLTNQQQRFLENFHQTGKAGESWTRAGYTASETTARSAASRFLKRDDAQAYLSELQQHDRQRTGLTREKMLNRLEQIIDSPDARDRDVIYAIKEANRMLGTYDKPKPPPIAEPPDPLNQYIAAVRKGEIPESQPKLLGHRSSEPASTPPPPKHRPYQPTEAETRAILNRPEPKLEAAPPTRRSETREERDARQDAQVLATRGRPNIPPSKSKPKHPESPPAPTLYTRLNRRRRAERKKQAAAR